MGAKLLGHGWAHHGQEPYKPPLVLGPSHTPLNEARGLINQCLGGEQSLINHCH